MELLHGFENALSVDTPQEQEQYLEEGGLGLLQGEPTGALELQPTYFLQLFPGKSMNKKAEDITHEKLERLTSALIEGGIIDKGPGKWGTDESYNTDFHRDITQLVKSAWE